VQLSSKGLGGGAASARIGYVQQDDALSPTQTVREALVFSAKLRSHNVDEVRFILFALAFASFLL
jgi:ABC-type multidrug transport system ATPase subunit